MSSGAPRSSGRDGDDAQPLHEGGQRGPRRGRPDGAAGRPGGRPCATRRRKGPSMLKPSGSAPSAGRPASSRARVSANVGEPLEGGGHRGGQERGHAARAGRAPCRPVPRGPPMASCPPQPWTWTSMKPGAMSDVRSARAGSASMAAMRPSSTMTWPAPPRSARTSRPETVDARPLLSHTRRPPRAPATWPGCSPPARGPGCCGCWRRRSRRPASGRRCAAGPPRATSSGVPRASVPWGSTAPPQKVRSRPNSRFKRRRVHARGGDLDGVEAVHADLDEVRDEVADGAAGVQEEARPRAALDEARRSRRGAA